jgi:hypothetical protein
LPGYTLTEVQNRVNDYLDAGIGAGTSSNATVTMVGGNVTPTVGPPYPVRTVTVRLTDSYWMLGPLATLVGAGAGDYGAITLTAIATMRMQTPGP